MTHSLLELPKDSSTSVWPKKRPPLTPEQQEIRDDFVRYWHEVLGSSKSYSFIENFNHGYVVDHAPQGFTRTLEIGAGLGEHLCYERLTPEQRANYVALELRANMVERLRERFPEIRAIQGDCQNTLDFPDDYFDRILAIHVLEHLPNLPIAVKQMHRLCNKNGGVFSIVIPCEGGLMYGLARRLSAQRVFQWRYKQPYKWFIEQEHLSTPPEIIEQVSQHFKIQHTSFYPFLMPSYLFNLAIGLTVTPR